MIRPLRTRHRATMTALALGLPVLFALGLAARRSPPLAPAPNVIAAPAVEPIAPRDLGALWPGLSVEAAVGIDPADPDRRLLRLVPDEPPAAPDLLIYWVDGPASETVPRGAILLGALAGTEPASYRLPAEASARPGTVLLYSLGWGRVLAAAPLPVEPDR